MFTSRAAVFLTLTLAASPCRAASIAVPNSLADEPIEEIVVTGIAKPFKLTAKQLRRALQVYAKRRPTYGPASQLLFEVKPKAGAGDLSGLRLRLRSGDTVIPISLDSASRFVLPVLPRGKWELVANRGAKGLRISPLVLSPGTTQSDWRLGDMRLQCEVVWEAFIKPELPLLARPVAAAVNACTSSRFGMFQRLDKRIASAAVDTGTTEKPVQLSKDRYSFRAPVYDKSLPNSARVRFRFD